MQPKDPNQLLYWGGHQDKQPLLVVCSGHKDKLSKDLNQLFAWGVHEANSKDLEDKKPKDPNQLLVWGGHQDKQPLLVVWGGHEDK